jgi:hypothetical protein
VDAKTAAHKTVHGNSFPFPRSTRVVSTLNFNCIALPFIYASMTRKTTDILESKVLDYSSQDQTVELVCLCFAIGWRMIIFSFYRFATQLLLLFHSFPFDAPKYILPPLPNPKLKFPISRLHKIPSLLHRSAYKIYICVFLIKH